jgi:hypothetical protein
MSILALTSDTLIGTAAAGNIEYNGQFFGTDSNASRAQLQRIVRATAVASTSGTSISFTSIPEWVERITVMFQGVSTSGSSPPQIQIGSGSFSTSGYLGSNSIINAAPGSALFTSGFGIGVNTSNWSGAVISHGSFTITLLTGNTWVCFGGVGRSDVGGNYLTNGSIALGGVLDRLRVTTVNGTDTFDAGTINIIYEG